MGIKTIKTISRKSLFFASAISLSVHCLSAELIEINRVIAKVNDRIVTWGEIDNAMTRLNFSDQEKKKRTTEFVEGEIDRLLSIAAFKEKGMAIPDTYVEQEYNKRLIRDFNGDRKLFRDYLRSNGRSQLEFRKDLEEEIIYSHMLSTRRKLKEEISPDKVEAYYDKHVNLFKTEEKVRLSEIAFSQIAGEPQSVLLQQARKVVEEFKKGVPFEKLAAQNGQSQFRDKAGDWGVMASEREIRNDEIRKRAFSLKKGEMSEPFVVETLERKKDGTIKKSGKFAVYLLLVSEKKVSGRKPLDEVRQEIERTLTSEYEAQSQRQWLGRLKKEAYVRITLPK
jgi:peptidyl-prolyl cis-trans isomerase SurA